MNFSTILDISSFFIGMIINLLLIALICYYFKKKYENLEIAQNEQAKVLYQLLQQNTKPKVINMNELNETVKKNYESDSDLDSDSDSDSDDDTKNSDKSGKSDKSDKSVQSTQLTQLKTQTNYDTVKSINLDLKEIYETNIDSTIETIKLDTFNLDVDSEQTELVGQSEKDYSKLTIKQLKELLSEKGINATKMKKNEMIELIEKTLDVDDKKIDKIEKLDISLEKSFVSID